MSYKKYELGTICQISAGGDRPDVCSDKKTEKTPVPIFSNGMENDGLYGYTDKAKVEGDVVTISARGVNVGTVCYRNEPFLPIVRLLSLIPNRQIVDAKYLYYVLRNTELSGTGSAQPQITAPMIKKQEIMLLEDMKGQRKIAGLLSSIDNKILLNRRINDNLLQQAQAMYKSWFIDYEPFDGVRPANWIIGTIDDLAKEVVCGKTPSTKVKEYYGSDVPFITIPDMHGNTYAVTTERYLSNYGAASQAKKTLPPNSICVSCIGTAGLVTFVASESQTNQQINSIIPKDEYSPFYIFLLMQTLSEVINKLGQSGSTIVNLNKAQFGKIKVTVPSVPDMKAFDETVAPLFALILANQKENIHLSSVRETLLPRLMSGELDVSDLNP